jgi:DNA-binding response OmpR family regulator
MRILVIEDYAPLRKAIAQGLREASFAVDTAGDGEEGLWYATTREYDAVVLDLMLPRLDGWTVLQRIRKAESDALVIILTARDALDDRVKGINSGADDYLVKPFAFEELLARIRALVRRKYAVRSPVIRIADLEIDTAARKVRRGGRLLELTAREYSLLEMLALRRGRLVTRTEIWEHLYDGEVETRSNVIDVYVGYIRRKIDRGGLPRLIHTRRGEGYILEARS